MEYEIKELSEEEVDLSLLLRLWWVVYYRKV